MDDERTARESGDRGPDLRQRAEARLRQRADMSAGRLPFTAAGPGMLHELEVHQIELEMQNEELRRTQAALEASRAKYFDLYDLAPVGYLALDDTGLILEANLTAASLLGVDRGALLRQPLTRYLVREDQDRYYLCRKRLLATGAPQACELRMVRQDGTLLWVDLNATVAPGGDDAGPVCRATLSDITERKRAEETTHAALAEKEVLLREVHHRVKNNLAAIVGLLDLQREAADHPITTAALSDIGSRIQSMALVHDQLYRSPSLARVVLQDYLTALVSHLRQAMGRHTGCVVAAEGVELGLDTAIPCGLIATELVTNALKYAFPGNAGANARGSTITVSMGWDGTAYTLAVADNGVGLPANFDWTTAKSLGLRLVALLGQRQLGGELAFDGSAGTRVSLRFRPRVAEEP